MRLFLAVPLDRKILDVLAGAVDRLRETRAPVRWVRPEGMHLTLKFLGETDPDRIGGVIRSVAGVSRDVLPFPMSVTGTGAYPGFRRPRVLWAGVTDDSGTLLRLWEAVETAADDLGWDREKRRFSPHITLGRVKGSMNLGRLTNALEELRERHWGEQEVREMVLYRSVLQRGGAVHEKVHVFELGKAE